PRAEERVCVRDSIVRAAGDAADGLAAPDVLQREFQSVDLDPVAALDELLCFVSVTLGIGAACQPERAVAPLGGAERRVGVDVTSRDLEPTAVGLEDRAARKFVGPVSKHRPV